VLKLGHEEAIKTDYKALMKLPQSYRAKTYWHTKYCMLQKYGKARRIPPKRKELLRSIARENGLRDAKGANIVFVDGQFRIADVNLSKRRGT
jgi:hypothetical protein